MYVEKKNSLYKRIWVTYVNDYKCTYVCIYVTTTNCLKNPILEEWPIELQPNTAIKW